MVARAEGGGNNEEFLFGGDTVSVWEDEAALWVDDGDGLTAM